MKSLSEKPSRKPLEVSIVKKGVDNAMRNWTCEEEKLLVDWYDTHTDYLNLEKLSAITGRTTQFLCRKARGLGLTRFGRKPSWFITDLTNRIQAYNSTDAGIENRDRALQIAQKKNKECHPRGMLGKMHTDDTRVALSEKYKIAWANPYSKFNSDEFRELRSKKMSEYMRSEGRYNPTIYNRAKGGKREDLGNTYFRSTWEANYARFLNFLKERGEISFWEYEPDTYVFEQIKKGIRSYTPDFKIWDTAKAKPYYVEVKGWMDSASKTKLNRMKKYYPEEEVRIVQKDEYNEIKNKLSRLIENWE